MEQCSFRGLKGIVLTSFLDIDENIHVLTIFYSNLYSTQNNSSAEDLGNFLVTINDFGKFKTPRNVRVIFHTKYLRHL